MPYVELQKEGIIFVLASRTVQVQRNVKPAVITFVISLLNLSRSRLPSTAAAAAAATGDVADVGIMVGCLGVGGPLKAVEESVLACKTCAHRARGAN